MDVVRRTRRDPDGEVRELVSELVRLELYLADEDRRVEGNLMALPTVKLSLAFMLGFEFGGLVDKDFPFEEDCDVRDGDGGRVELAVEFRLDDAVDIVVLQDTISWKEESEDVLERESERGRVLERDSEREGE